MKEELERQKRELERQIGIMREGNAKEELEMKKSDDTEKTVNIVSQTHRKDEIDSLLKELIEKMNRIEEKLEGFEKEKQKTQSYNRPTEYRQYDQEYDRGRPRFRGNWNRRGRGSYGSYYRRNNFRRRNVYDDQQESSDHREDTDTQERNTRTQEKNKDHLN